MAKAGLREVIKGANWSAEADSTSARPHVFRRVVWPVVRGESLNAILQQAGPSQMTQSILQKLGGTAGRVAERAAEPIPLPSVSQNATEVINSRIRTTPYRLIPHSACSRS
jgi:hypothetical protein